MGQREWDAVHARHVQSGRDDAVQPVRQGRLERRAGSTEPADQSSSLVSVFPFLSGACPRLTSVIGWMSGSKGASLPRAARWGSFKLLRASSNGGTQPAQDPDTEAR